MVQLAGVPDLESGGKWTELWAAASLSLLPGQGCGCDVTSWAPTAMSSLEQCKVPSNPEPRWTFPSSTAMLGICDKDVKETKADGSQHVETVACPAEMGCSGKRNNPTCGSHSLSLNPPKCSQATWQAPASLARTTQLQCFPYHVNNISWTVSQLKPFSPQSLLSNMSQWAEKSSSQQPYQVSWSGPLTRPLKCSCHSSEYIPGTRGETQCACLAFARAWA